MSPAHVSICNESGSPAKCVEYGRWNKFDLEREVKAAGPRIPLPGAVANLLTLVLRAIAVRGIMEHRFVVRLDSLVAFASRVLQPLYGRGDM